MDDIKKESTEKEYEDDFDLIDAIKFLFRKKILISSVALIATIFAIFYSLSIQNLYMSKTLLAPSDEKSSMYSQLGSLSPLAGLAGINIGQAGLPVSKSFEAIERIESFEFFANSFLPNIAFEDLMAVESWDPILNKLTYDREIYNEVDSKWVRKATFPQTSKPTNQEAYKKYLKALTIRQEKQTSFVSISIIHESPFIAKKWVEIIVQEINSSMQEIDKKKASNNISFLYDALSKAEITEVKKAISEIVEIQMKVLMTASADDSYVYKTIYHPIAPEEKVSPNRSLIVIIGFSIGLLLGILISLIIFIRKKRLIEKWT